MHLISKFSLKSLGFLAALLITSRSMALSNLVECSSQASDQEVISCLNSYAKNIFHLGGSQSLEAQFYIDFLALADAQKLKIREAPASLTNSFQIEIPRTRDMLSLDSPSCFQIEPSWGQWATGQTRENRTQIIASQMQQVGLFLKHVHLLSLGQESSILFPLRRIEICGAEEKSFEYSQGVLKLNLDPSLSSLFSAQDLFSLWSSGDLVFGPKPGVLESARNYFQKDAKALLTEKMRSLWALLNPTGDLRFRLRVLLQNHLARTTQLPARADEFGVHLTSMTEEQKTKLQEQWLENLNNPQFISTLTEQALLQTQFGITQVTNIDHRRNIGLVNVKNNKQINVDLHGLFGEVYPFEGVTQDRRLESHSLQVGLVNVDLIDQVNVNLSIPQGLPQWIEKTTLKKAAQDLGL